MRKLLYGIPLLALILASGQVYALRIKIATLSPGGSAWMKTMTDAAKQIAARTDKRVTFKFYPGGVMGNDKTVLRKIRVHQLHGGAITNGTLNPYYPDNQVYNLVMKFNNYDEVDYVRAALDPIITNGLEENGLAVLGLMELGFAYIMSTHPIQSLSDLRARKVWIPENNNVATHAMDAFGITPIPLPMRDVLVALQTEMVDTVATSPTGALALQWHTKIKYLTDVPILYFYGAFVVDKKTFNKIKLEDQKIVREIMGAAMQKMGKQNRKDNDSAMQAIANEGIKIVQAAPGAKQELRRKIATANHNMVKAGRMSQAIIDKLEARLTEFRSKHSNAKND